MCGVDDRYFYERFDAYRSYPTQGGRISEPASYGITEQLVELGFTAGRMKTGTPVRIDGRSIHFEEATEQRGEDDFHKFSFLDFQPRPLKQRSCWTIYTNEQVHDILRAGLPDSLCITVRYKVSDLAIVPV